MSAALQVRGLRVVIDGASLLDVETLTVEAGTLCVVAGAAASGKSLLGAALAGMLPAAGTVEVMGRRCSGAPSRRRRRGLAVAVRDGVRVEGCSVDEALRIAGMPAAQRASTYAALEPLARRRSDPAGQLSGGEQQLLQVACALAAHPAVIVLDTPTVGLAASAAAAVAQLVADAQRAGSAVLWLENDDRAAPQPPDQRLLRGTLSPV